MAYCLEVGSTKLYLTNGEVAWEVPEGDISFRYQYSYYLPWQGWHVVYRLKGKWRQDEFGCLRRIKKHGD